MPPTSTPAMIAPDRILPSYFCPYSKLANDAPANPRRVKPATTDRVRRSARFDGRWKNRLFFASGALLVAIGSLIGLQMVSVVACCRPYDSTKSRKVARRLHQRSDTGDYARMDTH